MTSKQRLSKPEPVDVQGICVLCLERKQVSRGHGKYRPVCTKCHLARGGRLHKYSPRRRDISIDYTSFKKEVCERCGFVPEHSCQLDVDHIDGNRYNNSQSNLQTLCANCHRLKTLLNQDWKRGEGA